MAIFSELRASAWKIATAALGATTLALVVGLTAQTLRLKSAELTLANQIAANNQLRSDVQLASAQATASAQAAARAAEARYARIQQEETDALNARLDEARARADAYRRQLASLRDNPAPRGSPASGPDLSSPSGPAEPAPAPLGYTLVADSDIDACTDAYVIATGWQQWYLALQDSAEN